jgi:hypothetical protein
VGEFGILKKKRLNVTMDEDSGPTSMVKKGVGIGKGRRKIDVTMFSPGFSAHVKNGIWN